MKDPAQKDLALQSMQPITEQSIKSNIMTPSKIQEHLAAMVQK